VMGSGRRRPRSSELKDAFVPDSDVVLQRQVSRSVRITKVFWKAPSHRAPYSDIAVGRAHFTRRVHA